MRRIMSRSSVMSLHSAREEEGEADHVAQLSHVPAQCEGREGGDEKTVYRALTTKETCRHRCMGTPCRPNGV